MLEDLLVLMAWIPGCYRGPPMLGRCGLSRVAGAEAAEEDVADQQSSQRGLMGARAT